MKRALALGIVLAACDPGPDIKLGPFDFGGYTIGDRGLASFALADGCPNDSFWGCPPTLPPLAIGASARFVVNAIDGDGDVQDQLARATAHSSNPSVATAARDDNGILTVTGLVPGSVTIELLDDGDLVDSIPLDVEAISSLSAPTGDSNIVLVGTRIGARVEAHGGGLLYARGAIAATPSGALALLPDPGGFFSASDQVAVTGTAAGAATMTFTAGTQALAVPYTVVTRAELTRISFGTAVIDQSTKSRTNLVASAYMGDVLVRGGAACDWSVVSGGGPDVALSSSDGDDTSSPVFGIYTPAVLIGRGDVVVQCRANDQAIAQVEVKLLP